MRKLSHLLALLLCLPIFAAAQAKPATPSAPKAAAKPATPAAALPVLGEGKSDSPLVIETFTDYQCPPCRQFYLTTLRRVIEEYCNTGKAYVLHHDFPWPAHAYSHQAARWAVAAAVIGKFEVVSEQLYTKQDTWAPNGKIEPVVAEVLSPAELKKLKDVMTAREAEIDASVNQDWAFGQEAGVNQTPSIRITYKGAVVAPLHGGQVSFALLKHFLDEQLAK
jgi:protein-disulfide isomerase